MKTFKKIMFIVLALLPVLLVLYNACVGVFADTSAGLVPLGSVDIVGGELIVESDTWADYLLTPLNLDNVGGSGLIPSVFNLVETLRNTAGIPINLPVIMAVFYFVYLFILFLLDILVDLLLFVPRKCLEVLK